jgi:hypothetical protein
MPSRPIIVVVTAVIATVPLMAPLTAADPQFQVGSDDVVISSGEAALATYRFRDEQIPRPYFCAVHTPGGVLVTRNLPPQPGDLDDHATFHPGIWLAFGDLSGADSWRLKARVEHVEFTEPPAVRDGVGAFAVRNRYRDGTGEGTVCTEDCRYTITLLNGAWRLTLDSRFTSEREFAFGDQEEMGLGVRMATVIAEKSGQGGLLTDSDGRTTAGAIWGQTADWCDYSGLVDGRPAGITIMPHPDNFRRSWWHARDYGFFAANPFGRNAFTKEEKSRMVVKPGEEFRLRYAVIVHDGRAGGGYDPQEVFDRYRSE